MNAFSQSAFSSMDLPSSGGHALAPGTRLEYFEIAHVLSTSSFGIVYLATDLVLQQPVAIKEYLPTAAASRSDGLNVTLQAAAQADAFQRGRRAFIHEARMLARCDNPALLRILRLWEGNGTVYRAMPYYAGTSLLTWRQSLQDPPQEAWLRNFSEVLLGALDTLGQAGLVHRRITPSNILLQPDERPVLLDFDAVRSEMVSDQAQSLMAALDPAFAPVTPEPPAPEFMQGMDPDLHSVAALMHFCISGHWPASAQFDSQWREPLTDVVLRLRTTRPHLHYSSAFLVAIDKLLTLLPRERPRSTAEFRAAFEMAQLPLPVEAAPVSDPAPPPAASLSAAFSSVSGSAATPPNRAAAVPAGANPSASVLNLLASFDRRAVDRSASAEPVSNPVPPVLTDQVTLESQAATPAQPPAATPSPPVAPAFPNSIPPMTFSEEFSQEHHPAIEALETGVGDVPWEGLSAYASVSHGRSRQTSWQRHSTVWGATLLVLVVAGAAVWKINDLHTADSALAELAGVSSLSGAPTLPASPAPSLGPTHGTPTAKIAVPEKEESGIAPADEQVAVPKPSPAPAATPSVGKTNASAPVKGTTATVASPPVAELSAAAKPARGPSSPREVCSGRTEFSLFRCMQLQCTQAQWKRNAQCRAFLGSNGAED